jgi:hypothetical protein
VVELAGAELALLTCQWHNSPLESLQYDVEVGQQVYHALFGRLVGCAAIDSRGAQGRAARVYEAVARRLDPKHAGLGVGETGDVAAVALAGGKGKRGLTDSRAVTVGRSVS